MGKLDRKVAIVTGGGTGIGSCIALEFAKAGANVVVGGRTVANLEKVAEEIKTLGRDCLAVATDIRIPQDTNNLVKQTVDRFSRIDILVNNAGITKRASFLETTEDIWDDVLDTHLKGTFFCTQAVARSMMQQKYGKIINISSIVGRGGGMSAPVVRVFSYAAAKAGVIQVTKSCARELGTHGINVNGIAAGLIITDMTSRARTPKQIEEQMERAKQFATLGRVGSTQDIANMALFLATDDSSFINGQTIAVDGGRMDRM